MMTIPEFIAKWRKVELKERSATQEHFNTSKEQWRALGGEMGYAIILKGRIVWKRRLAIS